jgi:hypothetical protein
MTQAQITRRERAVSAAIGSVRAEGLNPSTNTKKHLRDYASGKITAGELRKKTIARIKH